MLKGRCLICGRSEVGRKPHPALVSSHELFGSSFTLWRGCFTQGLWKVREFEEVVDNGRKSFKGGRFLVSDTLIGKRNLLIWDYILNHILFSGSVSSGYYKVVWIWSGKFMNFRLHFHLFSSWLILEVSFSLFGWLGRPRLRRSVHASYLIKSLLIAELQSWYLVLFHISIFWWIVASFLLRSDSNWF
jgi:hypothetical protein